jgi:hypothetical protein
MIPMPAGETELIISLDNIIPDRSRYELYLKMTYFRKDKNGRIDNTDISEVFGGTLNFSVTESKWHSWSRLPEHIIKSDDMEIDSPYNLVGSVKSNLLFMSLGENNSYSLLIKDKNGHFVKETSLDIGESAIIYKDFFLSNDGILNAIVFTDQEARVMWWRTDKLLNNGEFDG